MAFFRAGLIEAWGRGTLKIIQECKDAGLPEPVFSYDQAGFRIEFKKAVRKTSEKILTLIKADRKITIAELSEKIGITERSIERNLRKLQKENLLKRIGGAKGGHWEVVEE